MDDEGKEGLGSRDDERISIVVQAGGSDHEIAHGKDQGISVDDEKSPADIENRPDEDPDDQGGSEHEDSHEGCQEGTPEIELPVQGLHKDRGRPCRKEGRECQEKKTIGEPFDPELDEQPEDQREYEDDGNHEHRLRGTVKIFRECLGPGCRFPCLLFLTHLLCICVEI